MAIHDQNYVRYEGPLSEHRAWIVIATTSLRLYLSFLRTKLVLLFLWLAPVIAAVLVIIEYVVRSQMTQLTEATAPGPGSVAFFLQVQLFSLALVFAASGCGVISDDLRHRTFQLYFSKPLSRWEYAVGKILSLFMLGALVTILPACALAGLRVAFFAQGDFLNEVAKQAGIGVALSFGMTVLLSIMLVGLSSLTRRTGYVVLAWIGIFLVPLITQVIISIATGGSDLAMLWSLPGNLNLLTEALMTDTESSVPMWAPYLVLSAIAAAAVGSVSHRVTRLEGVA